MEEEIVPQPMPEEIPESKYTGGAIVRKLISFAAFLVSLITLSLASPAMMCWKQRYECRHTYIDGKRLVFDGKAMQLFGKYILWLLLSVITLGIYLFWLSVKKKKWVAKHTHVYTEEYAAAEQAMEAEKAEQASSEEAQVLKQTKLAEKRRQAHTMGIASLILIFAMPPIGLIFGITALIYGIIYKEKLAVRLGTVTLCILGIVLTVMVMLLTGTSGELNITLFIVLLCGAAVISVAVCVAVWLVTKKWKSYSDTELPAAQ